MAKQGWTRGRRNASDDASNGNDNSASQSQRVHSGSNRRILLSQWQRSFRSEIPRWADTRGVSQTWPQSSLYALTATLRIPEKQEQTPVRRATNQQFLESP